MYTFPEIGLVLVAVLLTAAVTLLVLGYQSPANDSPLQTDTQSEALLFDRGILHHVTEGRGRLTDLQPDQHDWSDLRDKLLARFPDFPKHLDDAGTMILDASDGDAPHAIEVKWRGDLRWVTFLNCHKASGKKDADQEEIIALRRASETAPHPVWQEDARGKVTWYNTEYASLFQKAHGTDVDTVKRLFSRGDPHQPNRVALEGSDGTATDWYELTAIQSGDTTVFHASCINAVIAAENTQRNYMQTLAKTFAHLSIGLAIFDRKGQLLMFNPALVDLTGLSAPFLSGRPAMLSFFDAMRENRRMPEPKNYRSWRQEIADVISAAADSRYQETWTLESGQTYNVTGRQHPDGATAFLIEDISAEMTLTRNYRIELEQAQIMVDAVADAMAIFSPSGVLTLSNSAFGELWGIDADAAFADMTLHDCTRIWKSSCVLATDLALLDRTFSRIIVGVPQDIIFAQRTQEIRCIVTHLASGSLLVQFRAQPIQQKKTAIEVKQTA